MILRCWWEHGLNATLRSNLLLKSLQSFNSPNHPGSWRYFTLYWEMEFSWHLFSLLWYTGFLMSNLSRPSLVPCACIYSSSQHLFSIYHILGTVLGSKNPKSKKRGKRKENLIFQALNIKDQSRQTFGVHWEPGG